MVPCTEMLNTENSKQNIPAIMLTHIAATYDSVDITETQKTIFYRHSILNIYSVFIKQFKAHNQLFLNNLNFWYPYNVENEYVVLFENIV